MFLLRSAPKSLTYGLDLERVVAQRIAWRELLSSPPRMVFANPAGGRAESRRNMPGRLEANADGLALPGTPAAKFTCR